MAAPTNLSFETAGVSAGLASGWTTATVSAAGIVGSFNGGASPPRAVESYEAGWLDDGAYLLTITGGTQGSFDSNFITPPVTVEQYRRWEATSYLLEIQGGTAGQFFGFATVEQYDGGWIEDPYVREIEDPIAFTDRYETGWIPTAYATTISGGTAGTFRTPSGTATVESYEHIFANVPFAVDLDANAFRTEDPHGLTSNQKGEIVTDGKPPGGAQGGIHVYVIVIDIYTFQVSVSPGPGTPITLTDVGFGTHAFKADETIYWCDVT